MPKISLFVLTVFSALMSFAMPAQVVIIRHAEKPPSGNQVNQQGCERAFSLPQFFLHDSVVNNFGPAAAIYAMAPASDDGTLRPIQTMAPTSEIMGLKLNDSFSKKDNDAIADEILNSPAYDGKTVLISWEHQAINDVAESLGLDKHDEPSKNWPDSVFDQAWVLSFTVHGKKLDAELNGKKKKDFDVDLEIIPEFVLPTDNPLGGFHHWDDGPQSPSASSPNLPSKIESECVNNDALNAIVRKVTNPALKDADFNN